MDKKCERYLRQAMSCSLKNNDKRANKYFSKASACATGDDAVQVRRQFGLHEAKQGNHENAEKLLRDAAEHIENIEERASVLLALSQSLVAQKKTDDAIKVLEEAEGMSADKALLCRIKALLSETCMLSDTVYETSRFTDAADYVLSNDCDIPSVIFNACSMAAIACSCMKYPSSAGYYAVNALKNADSTENQSLAMDCVRLACRGAVVSDDRLISYTEAVFDYIYDNGLFKSEDAQLACILYIAARMRGGQRSGYGKDELSLTALMQLVNAPYASELALYAGNFYMQLIETSKAGLEKVLERCKDDAAYPKLLESMDSIEFAQKACYWGLHESACPLFSHLLEKAENKDKKADLLNRYSHCCYDVGDFNRCVILCRELVAACYSENADDKTTADAYLLLSKAQLRTQDFTGATASYDIYLKYIGDDTEKQLFAAKFVFEENYPYDYCAKLFRALSEKCGKNELSRETEVDIYNRLGISLYRMQAPIEDETNAFELADTYANMDEKLNCSNFHAVILTNLAECYLRAGDADRALDTYKRADDIYETCPKADIIQHTSSLKQMATILVGREEYEEALKYLDRAISALETYNRNYATNQTTFQLSLCLNARGTVYYRMDKPENEVTDLTKALRVIENQPVSPDSKAMLYINRGEAYEKMGDSVSMASDYVKAIEFLEQSEDKDTSDNMVSRASKWLALGQYHEECSRLGSSAQAYESACGLLDSAEATLGDDDEFQHMHAFAHYQYANACCHPDNKDYDSALSAYCRSIEILERLPDSPSRSSHLYAVYESRSAFYEVFGEHALAVVDLENAKKYKETEND